MKVKIIILFLAGISLCIKGCSQNKVEKSQTDSDLTNSGPAAGIKYNKLTPEERRVIIYKGTEAPYSGQYDNFWAKGVYVCKRCGAPLFLSRNKFDAHCGWPSFDEAIPGAIKFVPDPDGVRTEAECARCGAHLGHVFYDEGFTPKNTRYCVNSISMNFIPIAEWLKMHPKNDTGIFAGGCFWGVQYYMEKIKGVISTDVGYIHSNIPHPTYEDVCTGETGAAEAVRVIFNPSLVSYEQVAKTFFDIHDPTELDRQGPDVGLQYRSAVFYENDAQKKIAEKLINILKNKGLDVKTQIVKADKFWVAEKHHQHYYDKNGGEPYCHRFVQRF